MQFVEHLKHFARSTWRKLELSLLEITIYISSFIFFIVNAKYVSYPDEFVNILGGVFINAGKLPYKDFFDHHLPFAWYLASLLLHLSFGSYVMFRMLWTAFIFILLVCLALWIKRHYRSFYSYYLVFLFAYPLMAVYFWFHLYLADSLGVLFFSLTFWNLMVQTISKKINLTGLIFASITTFCMLFSSLSYLYLALVLYAWQCYLAFFYKKKWLLLSIIIPTPYILYLIFILLTGSFKDFYFSNVIYNTSLYIDLPNYVRGRIFNPFKFALTLIFNFYTNYLPLLTRIRFLDLYLPIGVLSGMGTLLLLLLLVWQNPLIGILFFFVLSFSAPRSNIQAYKETDYQGSLFLVLGLIATLFVLYLCKRIKTDDELLNDIKRVSQFILTVFLTFSLIFLFANTYNKFFLRYTQQMPSITGISYTAQFIDSLLDKGDYYWIGPYEPHQEFFVKKGQLPGKYPTLLPQFRENDYLKQSFIEQFNNHPPKIIIYVHEASIFGTPSLVFGKFFTDWMANRYTSIEHIPNKITILKSPSDMTLKTDLYIRNDQIDDVLQRLRSQGYLE